MTTTTTMEAAVLSVLIESKIRVAWSRLLSSLGSSRAHLVHVLCYWRTQFGYSSSHNRCSEVMQSIADGMLLAMVLVVLYITFAGVAIVIYKLRAEVVQVPAPIIQKPEATAPIKQKSQERRRTHSATTIQAHFRGFSQRQTTNQRRHRAAIRIQSRTRGILVRNILAGQGLPTLARAVVTQDAQGTPSIHSTSPSADEQPEQNHSPGNQGQNNRLATPTNRTTHCRSIHRRAVKQFGSQVKAVIEVRMRLLAAVVLQSWFRMLHCREQYRRIFSSLSTAPVANLAPAIKPSAPQEASLEPSQQASAPAPGAAVPPPPVEDEEDNISCMSSLSSWSSTWNGRTPSLRMLSTDSIQYMASQSSLLNPHMFRASQEETDAIKYSITAYSSIVQLQTWWRASLQKLQTKREASMNLDDAGGVEVGGQQEQDVLLHQEHNVIATMEISMRKSKGNDVVRGSTTAAAQSSDANSIIASTQESFKLQQEQNKKSEDTVRTSNMSPTTIHTFDDSTIPSQYTRGFSGPRRRRTENGYQYYTELWNTTLDRVAECPAPNCNIELTASSLECQRVCSALKSDRPGSPFSIASSSFSDNDDIYEVILTSATGEETGCHVMPVVVCSHPTAKDVGCTDFFLGHGDEDDGDDDRKSKARKQAMEAAAKLYACKQPKQSDLNCGDEPSLYYVPTTEVEPLSDEDGTNTNPTPSRAFSSPSTCTFSLSEPTNTPHAFSSYTVPSDDGNSDNEQAANNRRSPANATRRLTLANLCSVPVNISARTSSSDSASTESSFFSITDQDLQEDGAFSFLKGCHDDDKVTVPQKSSHRRRRNHRRVGSEFEDDTPFAPCAM